MAGFLKQEQITESAAAQIVSQEHTEFSVWLGDPFQDSESAKFVARLVPHSFSDGGYIERGPLSLERLTVTDSSVRYVTKDGQVHIFDPLDFLALHCSHLPKPYESITRFYGWYSCRVRGERRKSERIKKALVGQGTTAWEVEAAARPSATWAACIKRVYEIDPLECPKCKAQMRVIAFITEEKAITAIMMSQGIAEQKPPKPLAAGPPSASETFDPGPEYW